MNPLAVSSDASFDNLLKNKYELTVNKTPNNIWNESQSDLTRPDSICRDQVWL